MTLTEARLFFHREFKMKVFITYYREYGGMFSSPLSVDRVFSSHKKAKQYNDNNPHNEDIIKEFDVDAWKTE